MCVCKHAHAPQHSCECQRTTSGSQFCPLTVGSGAELRPSGFHGKKVMLYTAIKNLGSGSKES